MDSISLALSVVNSVVLQEDNGSLGPSIFEERTEARINYGTLGTDTLELDRLYYKEHVLDKSGSVTIKLSDLPVEPAGLGSGGAMAKAVELYVRLYPNEDASTPSTGLRMGDATGANMAKLNFGSVSTTMDLGTGGQYLFHDDLGVAVGGDSIKFTNLDSSNTITFTVLLTGRSA